MTHDELIDACKGYRRPVVTVRTNAAPTLWALYEATPEHLAPFDESEVLDAAAEVREDKGLAERLCNAAQAAEPVYPPSPHVEEQLYERGFAPRHDEVLMCRFHAASWEERLTLARQFQDERYRRLSHRLVFFGRPDLLGDDYHRGAADELRRRLLSSSEAKSRWRSIHAAQWEMNRLVEGGMDGDALARQRQYAACLDRRRLELSAPNINPLAAPMVA